MTTPDSTILITGATGFLGRHVTHALHEAGYQHVFGISSDSGNLAERDDVYSIFSVHVPDVVIHCAADVGGIGYNAANAYDILMNNVYINMNVLDACVDFDVKKFVGIGSVCAYPAETPVPFNEDALWTGYPEATNAPYGISKRLLLEASQAAHHAHGLNAIHLILANLYGPGDTYELSRAHAIPAIIRRMHTAGDAPVTLLGTGRASRDFLYVKDAAAAIVAAMQNYDDPAPLNIGTGRETTISEVAHLIAALSKFENGMVWDTSAPDGQRRRCLDTARARAAGVLPPALTSLEDGLRATLADYRTRNNAV